MGEKKVISSVIIVLTLICVVFSLSFIYVKFAKAQYDSNAKKVINKENTQIVNNIDTDIESEFRNLEYFSRLVTSGGKFDVNDAMEQISMVVVGKAFIKLGVADTSGIAHMIDGSLENISELEYFKKALDGEYVVTDTSNGENEIKTNTYSIPIIDNNQIVGVIFVVIDASVIEEKLLSLADTYNCILWIVNSDGKIMFSTDISDDAAGNNDDIFSLLSTSDSQKGETITTLKQKINTSKEGFIKMKYSDDNKLICLKNIADSSFDWHMISANSQKEIDNGYHTMLSTTNIMVAVFAILYAVTLMVVLILQRKNRKKIEYIAYVDEITGGNSFTKFKDDVDRLIKNNSDSYVLVDLDVDKFKYINDIFGYEEGNHVIRFIWNEIQNILETGETFAHYRADQFVLLLKSNDMDHVIKRMELLALTVSKRESEREKNYEVVLSIGIYQIDKKRFQIDTAIDRAEMTKKSIKGKHSKIFAIYDEKLRQKVLRDQEIENMMEKAISNEEFKVYYQPKYNSSTCEISGAEALVRWYNEEVGMIFPNEFIPVFESNGFIVELDEYMFEHVCKDIRKWLDDGCRVVPVSVNLSQLQLYNMRFIDEYKEILDKYDIPPEYIQLELTETTLFSEAEILNDIIDELHKIGFTILMDDFGTGYSSLNMLKNVPVDILKLDKSFVDDIGDKKGDIVVSTIVSLGQLLNMKIVAEGVETKEQYEFLRDIFCDEIQGYYFSRPISSEDYRNEMTKGAL